MLVAVPTAANLIARRSFRVTSQQRIFLVFIVGGERRGRRATTWHLSERRRRTRCRDTPAAAVSRRQRAADGAPCPARHCVRRGARVTDRRLEAADGRAAEQELIVEDVGHALTRVRAPAHSAREYVCVYRQHGR